MQGFKARKRGAHTNPRMLKSPYGSDPLLGVWFQHLPDKLLEARVKVCTCVYADMLNSSNFVPWYGAQTLASLVTVDHSGAGNYVE